MSVRRIDVFFYGLFMDVTLLREKRVEPANVRPASVPGFALRIGQRATLVPGPNGRAYGLLMELSHDEVDELYSEPSVRSYRPEAVLVKLADGSRRPALCFNLVAPPAVGETNAEYASKLRDLAKRLQFPEDYVGSIR
jgi:Gamma-glutamyl cyclotransferase, AIG2-like